MKTCSSCGVLKPYAEFNKHKLHLDGYSSNCKECRKKTSKVYWDNHRDKLVARHKKYYRERRATDPSYAEYFREYGRKKMQESRDLVFAHYGNECACCGESDQRFLSIDHINGGGKAEREKLKKWGHNFYRWLIQQDYPEGYQALCFNCNCAKGFYGECPHEALKRRDMFYFVGGGC